MAYTGRAMVWDASTSAWVPLLVDATGRPVLDQALGGGGEPSWRPSVNPALGLTTRLSARLADLAAGFTITDQPAAFRTAQTPALVLAATVSGTPQVPPLNPALALATRINAGVAASQAPAAEVVQVQFNLTHRKGGVTATTSGPGWTNGANAQGDNDGTSARCTGAALDPAISTLSLNYSNFADKASLTITQVRLIFYSQLTNSAVLAPPVRFDYSRNEGGAWTNLLQLTTDYDDIPAGRAFVITPLPTWAELDAWQARMTVDMPALSALVTLDIDAIEVEITAALTWAL